MARGHWLKTRLIVTTCFGVDHNASEGLQNFGEELSARETKLEEYIPLDSLLLAQIPALLLRHAQIRWSNWLAAQWGRTSEVPFPNLAGLWTAIDNQEPWEPTFPAVYTFLPDSTNQPSPIPLTPARWNPVESQTAHPRASPTLPTPKAEAASRGGGRGGTNPSGGGGRGGSGNGSTGEERLNAIDYNNNYLEDRWGAFRHAGAMRLITRKASTAGVKLPSSPLDPKCKACPAYHIKGMCNTGCGNMGDHAVHTREQDPPPLGVGS